MSKRLNILLQYLGERFIHNILSILRGQACGKNILTLAQINILKYIDILRGSCLRVSLQVTLIGIVSYTNVSRACMTSYDRPECRDVSITTPATAVSSHCWLPKCEPQHHNPSFGCEQSNIRFYAVILVLYTIKLLFETKCWKSIDIYCAPIFQYIVNT